MAAGLCHGGTARVSVALRRRQLPRVGLHPESNGTWRPSSSCTTEQGTGSARSTTTRPQAPLVAMADGVAVVQAPAREVAQLREHVAVVRDAIELVLEG